MSEIRPGDLFGRLNRLGYKAMESATTFCKLRGNPRVELVHLFHQILNEPDSDVHRLVQHFGMDPSRLSAQMTSALDRLPRGASSISGFAQSLRETVEQGWVYSSLMYKQGKVRTGHLIVGLLKSPNLQTYLLGLSEEFRKIKVDELTALCRYMSGAMETHDPHELIRATQGAHNALLNLEDLEEKDLDEIRAKYRKLAEAARESLQDIDCPEV